MKKEDMIQKPDFGALPEQQPLSEKVLAMDNQQVQAKVTIWISYFFFIDQLQLMYCFKNIFQGTSKTSIRCSKKYT